jgi:hypothetical protein
MCGAGSRIMTICRVAQSEDEFLDKLTIALEPIGK